ncbi:hypothetical protein ACTXT7_001410 [Hymenolepis weldensis]
MNSRYNNTNTQTTMTTYDALRLTDFVYFGMRRTRRGSRDGFGPDQNGWEEQGGYMNAKIRKLESQFAEEPKKSTIFSGIRIYVNGYTEPPALEIRRLVQEHGGTYTQYYSQSAGDFMVAANLPLTKIKKINNQKIVKVSWITDSIAAGRLLPWKNFQLYPPHSQLKNQRALTSLMETKSYSPETTIASDEQSHSSHVASENMTNEISAFTQVVDEPSHLNTSIAGQTSSPVENTTLNESVGTLLLTFFRPRFLCLSLSLTVNQVHLLSHGEKPYISLALEWIIMCIKPLK